MSVTPNSTIKNKPACMLWYWGRRGGGCRYALELARVLSQNDEIDLHICISKQNELYDEFIKILASKHIVNTYDSYWTFFLSLFRIFFIRNKFQSYLRNNSIAKVISPMPHLWTPIMLPIFKALKIDYVSTIHDPQPHLGEIVSYPKIFIEKEVIASKSVICLSNFVADQIQEIYTYPKEKISVCPHGVFSFGDDFFEINEASDNPPFSFLFFGRILPYKGLGLLLEAFNILVDKGLNVELVIAGSGDVEEYSEKLTDERIHTEIRWIEENEIPRFYGRAHAIVLPHIAASQSGIWADATGFRKPCIVTPVSGLLEQIADGETGIASKEVSATSFAEAMETVMSVDVYDQLVSNLGKIDQQQGWQLTANTIVQRFMER